MLLDRHIYEIRKTFSFEAAHRLPRLPPDHKCHRLHGHSFKLTLVLRGKLDSDLGWVHDFGDVKRIFSPILDRLDHHFLNEIPGLENPTSEVIARWVYEKTAPLIPSLHQVVLSETCTSESIYPVYTQLS